MNLKEFAKWAFNMGKSYLDYQNTGEIESPDFEEWFNSEETQDSVKTLSGLDGVGRSEQLKAAYEKGLRDAEYAQERYEYRVSQED